MKHVDVVTRDEGLIGGQPSRQVTYHHYDSLADVVREEMPSHNSIDWSGVVNHGDCHSWFGCSSYSQVVEYVEKGWPEGLAKLREYMGKLKLPVVRSVRRTKERSDFGDFIDMQRVYAGDLSRAWETTRKRNAGTLKSNPVTLVMDATASASRTADQLFWNGATVALLCEAIQASGRSYQLIYTCPVHDLWEGSRRETFVPSVKVKDFTQPLSLEKVAATVCLAGFYRVFGFKMYMCTERRVHGYLGHCTSGIVPHRVKEHGKLLQLKQVWSKQQCEEYLKTLPSEFL